MKNTIPIALITVCSLMLSASGGKAQDNDLPTLLDKLEKTDVKSQKDEVRKLSEIILARDLIADFRTQGDDPLRKVMIALNDIGDLGYRIQEWKEELAEDPNSERLNLLLFVASRSLTVRNTRSSLRDAFPPQRFRLKRESGRFIAEIFRKNRWDEIQSETVPMPRKILVGFCANASTSIFKIDNFLIDGKPAPEVSWVQQQISRPATNGSFKKVSQGWQITGAGRALGFGSTDDIFFAFCEIEGDIELEVTFEEWSTENLHGMAGLMFRSSLDVGSTYVALAMDRHENRLGFEWRPQHREEAKYLTTLSSLRADDRVFIERCLESMLTLGMNEQALQTVNRLRTKFPEVLRENPSLFEEVYEHNGLKFQSTRSPDQLQPNTVPADWLGGRENVSLGWQENQEQIIALLKEGKTQEAQTRLNRLFLDETTLPSYQEMINSTIVRDAPWAPDCAPAIRMAVDLGVAMTIAKALEKVRGDKARVTDARVMALTLRLAAKDPGAISLAKQRGDGLPRQLGGQVSEQGLLLLAYQLQQSADTRPAAVRLIAQVLQNSGTPRLSLLLWKIRLEAMMGEKEALRKTVQELAKTLIQDQPVENPDAVKIALEYLQADGNSTLAEKVGTAYLTKYQTLHPSSKKPPEALKLLNFQLGKIDPSATVWTQKAKDDMVQVRWELVPYEVGTAKEIMPFGLRTPILDGKYDIEIYATKSEPWGDAPFGKEDLLTTISDATSIGSWIGRMPPGRFWLTARLRDHEGKTSWPGAPVTAVQGRNLLTPFDLSETLQSKGSWKATSNWIWGDKITRRQSESAWFLSRLQMDDSKILITHAPVSLDPNREYLLSGWLRTNEGKFYTTPSGAFLQVVFRDARGKQVGEFYQGHSEAGRWMLLTQNFGPRSMQKIPPTAVQAEVSIGLNTEAEVAEVEFHELPQVTQP